MNRLRFSKETKTVAFCGEILPGDGDDRRTFYRKCTQVEEKAKNFLCNRLQKMYVIVYNSLFRKNVQI